MRFVASLIALLAFGAAMPAGAQAPKLGQLEIKAYQAIPKTKTAVQLTTDTALSRNLRRQVMVRLARRGNEVGFSGGNVMRLEISYFDLTFNFLYQLGDPAIGVARNYISTNIVKGNPFGNQGAYVNPEVDKLFAEAAIASTDAARQELYTKVQKILVEDVPVLWLLEMDFPTIYRCNVKNLVTTGIGVNDGFRDAWKE